MKSKILIIAILSVMLYNSCKKTRKQENAETTTAITVEKVNNEIVTNSFTDKKGEKLELSFNHKRNIVSLNFNGEPIELAEQKSASGIWYKNNNYDLRGKGNDIELKKDGKIVFEHKDEIVTSSIENKEGHTLDMTFNNTTNQAKVYLNGGEQIELEGQNPASGIWYKNDQYELRGKGENVELTKDGKTVFKKY